MSARLWLDRTVVTETPANVFSRFRGESDQDFKWGIKEGYAFPEANMAIEQCPWIKMYIYIVPIEHWIFSSAMLVYQMVWSERDVAMTKVIACFLEHDESFKL